MAAFLSSTGFKANQPVGKFEVLLIKQVSFPETLKILKYSKTATGFEKLNEKFSQRGLTLACFGSGLGEIVVNEVNFVKKCINAESSQDDLWGKLICTNFKVSFIPQDAPPKQVTL